MRRKIDSVADLAEFIRKHRKSSGMTQTELAGASGLGPRFIIDLEKGKATCQLGKTLQLLHMLGINLEVSANADTDQ